ncbi:uncharacterized protein G2W53_037092 [Senna tora]|uniref:Uncharacterized protein n=1 Tax=Senna tora TaxID=362788 RepID=A0A834WAT5_9FABA|nr:uncharacterized protein G2W53_037092 [Senna tora]
MVLVDGGGWWVVVVDGGGQWWWMVEMGGIGWRWSATKGGGPASLAHRFFWEKFEGSIDRRSRATSRKSAIANLDPSRRGRIKRTHSYEEEKRKSDDGMLQRGTQNAQDVIRNRDPVALAIVVPLAVIIHLARPKNDFGARSVAAKEKEKRLIR